MDKNLELSIRMEQFEIETLRQEHEDGEDGTDGPVYERKVKRLKEHIAALHEKKRRFALRDDKVTIAQPLADGRLRIRECARVDLPHFKGLGFKLHVPQG